MIRVRRRALEQRHEERRGHALAGHVADDHRQPALAQLDEVEVVAAHGVGRAHDGLDAKVGRDIGRERKQAELDLPRDLEVALEAQLVPKLEHEQEERAADADSRSQPCKEKIGGKAQTQTPWPTTLTK